MNSESSKPCQLKNFCCFLFFFFSSLYFSYKSFLMLTPAINFGSLKEGQQQWITPSSGKTKNKNWANWPPTKVFLFIKLFKLCTHYFYTAAVMLFQMFWFTAACGWGGRTAEEDWQRTRAGERKTKIEKKSINTLVNESQLFTPRWASWISDCAQYADWR